MALNLSRQPAIAWEQPSRICQHLTSKEQATMSAWSILASHGLEILDMLHTSARWFQTLSELFTFVTSYLIPLKQRWGTNIQPLKFLRIKMDQLLYVQQLMERILLALTSFGSLILLHTVFILACAWARIAISALSHPYPHSIPQSNNSSIEQILHTIINTL